jgi:hypothetical protein
VTAGCRFNPDDITALRPIEAAVPVPSQRVGVVIGQRSIDFAGILAVKAGNHGIVTVWAASFD